HFFEFTRMLINLRQRHPVLRRRRFFQGRPLRGHGVKDLAWIDPSGVEMSDEMWAAPHVQCLGMMLSGIALDETTTRGEPMDDRTFCMLLNAGEPPVEFVVPVLVAETPWTVVFD